MPPQMARMGLWRLKACLQQELVDGGAGGVGRAALGDRDLRHIFAGQHRIGFRAEAFPGPRRAAGPRGPAARAGERGWAWPRRNGGRRDKAGKRALVVGRIDAGGLGNGDMYAHGRNSVSPRGSDPKGDWCDGPLLNRMGWAERSWFPTLATEKSRKDGARSIAAPSVHFGKGRLSMR